MKKGSPNVNGREKTKDHNDNDISIHASGDEIQDNANEKGQGSNASGIGDDDEECSSDDNERGKGRYQDLLNCVQEEMSPQIESEFAEICGKYGERQNQKVKHRG